MRILITGTGMLGGALAQAARARGHDVAAFAHQALDVTDGAAVRDAVSAAQPGLVLHAAGLTRVNYCEEHPAHAFAVNQGGARNVTAAAQELDCPVVYFSTDYVFDGAKAEPWLEDDPPHPLNVYGASKLAGEAEVLEYAGGRVVRTSGVFGPRTDGGVARNFFRAIAQPLRRGELVRVVSDQTTAVTFAPALAEMVLELVPDGLPRIVHLVCGGGASWYGWARLAAQSLGAPETLVRPVLAAADPSAVRRPARSVLASAQSAVSRLIASHPAARYVAGYCAGLLVDKV